MQEALEAARGLALTTGLAVAVLAGCGAAEGRRLAQPVIDTLPGGIERVISPGPTSWEDTTGWRVELVQEITGEPETPSELLDPQSLALDDWGRVFVADQKPATIKVYDAAGRFIRTIGNEGEGPGEFRTGFVAVHDGQVVVHDPRLARTSVWDTAGTFVRSWVSSCCYWSDIHVDRHGTIYIRALIQPAPGELFTGSRAYTRWSLAGALIDTLWLPGVPPEEKSWLVTTTVGGRTLTHMSLVVPLTPRLLDGFNPAGGFLVGQSSRYQIVVAPRGVDSAGVFGRTWTGTPVPAERKRHLVDGLVKGMAAEYGEANLRQIFKLEDIPDQAPAFIALHVDREGNRWVRMDPGQDSTQAVFDIFREDGVYLGATTISPAPPIYGRLVFGRDQVVVARENTEGLPVVARYRVVKGKK